MSPLCKNDNPSCEFWAQNGECEKNSGYMFVKCMKACNVCGNSYSFNRITYIMFKAIFIDIRHNLNNVIIINILPRFLSHFKG